MLIHHWCDHIENKVVTVKKCLFRNKYFKAKPNDQSHITADPSRLIEDCIIPRTRVIKTKVRYMWTAYDRTFPTQKSSNATSHWNTISPLRERQLNIMQLNSANIVLDFTVPFLLL